MEHSRIFKLYEECRLCPRRCGVTRRGAGPKRLGLCGQTDQLRVAHVGPHFGEEPPISGVNGSGTVFFTGCALRCRYCQNHQISLSGMGRNTTSDALAGEIGRMIRVHGVHNINFVTPDHFFPHVFGIVSTLRQRGFHLPVAYNLSGYQSVEMLRHAEDFADIYLPDFKYSDASLAARLSNCPDYPDVALGAISEMVRQKGRLDACEADEAIARKGVLVRHLILPGKLENSLNVLTTLFLEFGRELPLSLMSQYHPTVRLEDEDMNRSLAVEEFDRVYAHAAALGFENLFVQFPDRDEENSPNVSPFLPDFREPEPFAQGHAEREDFGSEKAFLIHPKTVG